MPLPLPGEEADPSRLTADWEVEKETGNWADLDPDPDPGDLDHQRQPCRSMPLIAGGSDSG